MLKSEIRKYVRTDNGYILENTIRGHRDIIEKLANEDKHYEFEYGKIVKHSNSLIEIIEVGDYINGEKVLEIRQLVENKEIAICVFKSKNGAYYRNIKEEKIKNILTHEQYVQNCYEI